MQLKLGLSNYGELNNIEVYFSLDFIKKVVEFQEDSRNEEIWLIVSVWFKDIFWCL